MININKFQFHFYYRFLKIWNIAVIITCIMSIFTFAFQFLTSARLGLSFPFYAQGSIDRQVFGPAMAFVSISSLIVTYNLSFYKNKFLYIINFVSFLLSFICAIGSASRGPILIYFLFLLFGFIFIKRDN